ncbi:hypothetical protein FRC08_009896 [Ceratobasidium sp. 394]|nr:hypothetical protein FRC08_009896 [Ceratobasidium sp. 394]KAG9096342.1 hypothetical protein FS749_008685 [Ceratobasidium sp. UAMH 11750]
MKRVERRGTTDANMLAGGLGPLPLHQHSFHSQSQSQTQPTQPQTQLSQTQLGTQYSPQHWNGNGRYENGRYGDPRGEKRYDLLPSHYGLIPGAPAAPAAGNGVADAPPTEKELAIMRRKGGVTLSILRRKKREESAEKAEAPAAAAAPAESTWRNHALLCSLDDLLCYVFMLPFIRPRLSFSWTIFSSLSCLVLSLCPLLDMSLSRPRS